MTQHQSDFHLCDLRFKLHGADLRGADLSNAFFYEADLQDADLRAADLRGANLSKAYMHSTNLKGANLRGARMSGAFLREADLRGADLRGADLRFAYLLDVRLNDADLRGATLPDGTVYEKYISETVPALLTAGGKTLQDIIDSGAWECHDWRGCPLSVAYGARCLSDVPIDYRYQSALFLELYDSLLLPLPAPRAA